MEDNVLKIRSAIIKFYLNYYLKKDNNIINLGLDNSYFLYYAKRGYLITALRYSKNSTDTLLDDIDKYSNSSIKVANPLDLSSIDDNSYDFTMLLDCFPVDCNDDNFSIAISELTRITKKSGIIAISYINKDGIFNENNIDNFLDNTHHTIKFDNGVYLQFGLKEMQDFMNHYNVKMLDNISTDGVSQYIPQVVNNYSKEEFIQWIKCELSLCEKEDVCKISTHLLFIGEKI